MYSNLMPILKSANIIQLNFIQLVFML